MTATGENSFKALYLHIPFCASRCAYCDFATEACSDDARMDAYVDALSLAVRRAAHVGLLGNIETIYIGGGTPTHLGMRRLNSLVYLLSLSIKLENVVEFTIEANPESIDERMVKDLFALGVDRYSIGAQSFDDAVLAAYGRIHDAAAIDRAIAAVQSRADNFSLDLICGGPGQSLASWEESLHHAVASGARHVSIYPLMLKEGTPLAARVAAGECAAPDDDAEADMMLAAERVLGQAGMKRYEVASYAYPGYESKHNGVYWNGTPYLGLGAGAASMMTPELYGHCLEAELFALPDAGETQASPRDGAPTTRVRVDSSADSDAFAASGGRPAVEVECLSAREALLEDLMLGFRRTAGVSCEDIEIAVRQVPQLEATMRKLVDERLLEQRAERYMPTERGWLVGNEIFGAIWGLAE